MELNVQTRDEDGSLQYFSTFKEAFDYASVNSFVWKVSANLNGENIRFVKRGELDARTPLWKFEPIMEAVDAA